MNPVVGGSLDLRAEVCQYIGSSMMPDRDLRRATMQGIAPKVSRVVEVLGSRWEDCKRLELSSGTFCCRSGPEGVEELVWALGGTGKLVLLAVRRGLCWEVIWYEPGKWETSLDAAYGCLRERAAVG